MSVTIKVCSHYRAKAGQVFISQGDGHWRRARCETVQRRGWWSRVIKCSLCDLPAVQLDHLYSYHSECNRCAGHLKAKGQA